MKIHVAGLSTKGLNILANKLKAVNRTREYSKSANRLQMVTKTKKLKHKNGSSNTDQTNNGVELICFGRVSYSCSSVICRVPNVSIR